MATEKQLPKLAGILVEHQNAFASLSSEDAQWVILNPKEAIALACDAIKNRAKEAIATLLTFVGSVVLPATEKFVAKKNFTKGKANIGWMGDNFKNRFLGKTEEQVKEGVLKYFTLARNSRDMPIVAELGGEEKCEIALAHVFMLIERQKTASGDGPLLTNGYANIFYVRDKDGVLCTVNAFWYADDGVWDVNANPIDDPIKGSEGLRVFSSN